MNNRVVRVCTGLFAGAIALNLAPSPSLAGTFRNGWQYAIDPSYDSLGSVNGTSVAGGTIYETYGIAIHEDADNNIWVAINSNMPITGNQTGPTLTADGVTYNIRNDSIAWGDLFFDLSGTGNLRTASDTGSLLAVRFADNNDSLVETGVYRGVRGTSVARFNAGYRNLRHNNDRVQELNQNDIDAWMGDIAWDNPYFDPYFGDYSDPNWWNSPDSPLIPNVIDSGEKIGDVTIRSEAELVDRGFDLSWFFQTGANIFGFSFPKTAEFVGDFIATLLQECINDGISLLGRFNPPSPPPPPPDECPVTLGQLKALAPDYVDGEWKIFYDTLSHQWYDPPPYTGFEFYTLGGSKFTQILDFPCGISTNDKFTVIAHNPDGSYDSVTLNNLHPGDSVDFVKLFGHGINHFSIFGVIELGITEPFSLQVALDRELGSFKLRPVYELPPQLVPESDSIWGLIALGLIGVFVRLWHPKK